MENLEVGRQPPRDGAPAWTPERLFALFPNLGRMRERPGGRMSGGEQQMLTIARTLMGNPHVRPARRALRRPGAADRRADGEDDPRAERARACRVLLWSRTCTSPRRSPTAPISSRRARSASAARWPSSPPTPRFANSTVGLIMAFRRHAHGRHRRRRHLHRPARDRPGDRRASSSPRCRPPPRTRRSAFWPRSTPPGADPAELDAHRPRHHDHDQRAARAQARQGRADHHQGFRDVLELGRRTRPQPYGLTRHASSR